MKVLSVIVIFYFASITCNTTNKMERTRRDWSAAVNGIQCRVRFTGITSGIPGEDNMIELELKNMSKDKITIFDFQDKPLAWPVSARYLRGMLIGINGEEPYPFHLLSKDIERPIELQPGDSHSYQLESAATKVKLLYDTKMVEHYWAGVYWKGRIELPEICR